MFCPNCGKNLPDNSAFCDGCGTRLAAAPAPQAPAAPVYNQAPAQSSPILDDSIAAFKGFFSKEPTAAIDKASKSTGLEWLILFGIIAFFNMFYTALAPCHWEGDFDALGLVGGLLETGLYFFGMSFAVLLLFKLAYNKDVAITKIFNVTAVAMLPLGCSYLLNIIFGFVWSGLTSIVYDVTIIAFALLLYYGIQKLGEVKIPVWSLLILFAAVLLVLAGWGELWAEITGPSIPDASDISSAYGDAMNAVNDMMSAFG